MIVLVDELGETSRSVKVFERHNLPRVDCSSVWVILIMLFNETSLMYVTACKLYVRKISHTIFLYSSIYGENKL